MGYYQRLKQASKSIQTRLLLSFLLSAFLMIVLVVVVNQSIQNQLNQEADASLLAAANGIANSIDEFNRRNLQSFEMASSLPIFADYVKADEETRAANREETLATLRSLQIQPWNQFYALSFAILDREGNNILDTLPANIGRNEGGTSYFREALLNGIPNTSNVNFNRQLGNVSIFYSAPIREAQVSSPVVGMLRVQVAVSTLQDMIFAASLNTDTASGIMLFDNNLVRLADTENPQLLFRTIADLSPEETQILFDTQMLPPLPQQQVVQPIAGLAQTLWQTRTPTVGTHQVVPGQSPQHRLAIVPLDTLPWYIVVSKPTDRFYAPIQNQTRGIALMSLLLVMAAVGSSLVFSRSVTRPISELTTIAKQVASGNLQAKARIPSEDEIGILAQTFNQMTDELDHVKTNLEHLVAERTQKLSQANEALKHEITERQRFEKQALDLALEQERTRILTEFIQDSSHEFKTPLSIINVKTHLLQRLSQDDQSGKHIDGIIQQSQQIERIVNTMVMMSRLDGSLNANVSAIRVDYLVESLYNAQLAHFERSSVHLSLELHCPDIMINANAELLTEAVLCILDNARKFTPAGGQVSMGTYPLENRIEIRVVDTGIGITPVDLPRIFERFYRADAARTSRGIGLGLPIAKRIIELLLGSITIESEVHQGTRAVISLPIIAA